MNRRDFLSIGTASLAGATTHIPALAESAANGAAHPPKLPNISAATAGGGPLAPVADFPQTFRSTYLNAAALGLRSEPARRAFEEFGNGLAAGGTPYYFGHLKQLEEVPRSSAARLFGTKPEHIGFVSCISEAVSQFAWWLRPGRGKNVVSIDIECPATTLSWMRVAQETGAEVRLASVWDDISSLSFDKLAALVDKNTVAICISHVQWITGYRMDLKAVADLAHAYGAILIVDAMHSAGVLPLDVHRDDVDVLVTGGYKWVSAYAGVAPIYVRPALMDQFNPILMGAMTNRPAPPYDNVDGRWIDNPLPKGPDRFHYGSASHEAKVAFGAGSAYLADLGLDKIEKHVTRLGMLLADGLRKLGAIVVTPEDPARRAGIITAQFKGYDGVALSAALEKHDVYTSPRKGHVRFACHVFNDDEGVARALNAIEKLI